ncbi:MAG: hypothetical protein KGI27_12215 [Thaumarchaeota archaeon]|nr:hypothetical protein [Nitrososphaerota archaeon]
MNKRLPKIDLEELKKAKEENFRERLEFLDRYASWIKNANNSKWSHSKRALINTKTG